MENTFGAFMFGALAGISITIMFTISSLPGNKTIITDKKIAPEWMLTTDGKKVDTLYIYTQK